MPVTLLPAKAAMPGSASPPLPACEDCAEDDGWGRNSVAAGDCAAGSASGCAAAGSAGVVICARQSGIALSSSNSTHAARRCLRLTSLVLWSLPEKRLSIFAKDVDGPGTGTLALP